MTELEKAIMSARFGTVVRVEVKGAHTLHVCRSEAGEHTAVIFYQGAGESPGYVVNTLHASDEEEAIDVGHLLLTCADSSNYTRPLSAVHW